MPKYEHIIIFGLGGVGSWVADYCARNNVADIISLVDFDTVENKNLTRQNYDNNDETSYKADATMKHLTHLQIANDNYEILRYKRKIVDNADLANFDRNAVAIITTDNIASKRLIAEHFKYKIIVNCDKNFVEVKNFLDQSDLKAWDLGGGYSNAQNIASNLQAALLTYYALSTNTFAYFEKKRRLVIKVDEELTEKLMGCETA